MNREITFEEEKAAYELLKLVESIIAYLSTEEANTAGKSYCHLEKVKNILTNKSQNGYKNIERHLFMDFRMIYDHRMDDEVLGKMIEKTYSIAEHNSIFNS